MFDARRLSGLVVQKQNESLIANDFFKTVKKCLGDAPNYEESLYIDTSKLSVPNISSTEPMKGLFCSKDIKKGDIICIMNEKADEFNDGLMDFKSLMECTSSNEFYSKAILLRENYTNPEKVKKSINITMITDSEQCVYVSAYKDIEANTELVGYYGWDMWIELMIDIINPINFIGYYCLVRDASMMSTNDSRIKILLRVLPQCINSKNVENMQNTLEILNLYDATMASIEDKTILKESMRDVIISALIDEVNKDVSKIPKDLNSLE